MPILTFLKFCLLALLYLFLARVVWVVAARAAGHTARPSPQSPSPQRAAPPKTKAGKTKARQWRLVLVEPSSEAGTTYGSKTRRRSDAAVDAPCRSSRHVRVAGSCPRVRP